MCATEPRPLRRPRAHGPARRCARLQRGGSLVELMVGLVIALLVGLAATVSATGFTASQRQGVGSAGGGADAHLAAAMIRADAAAAGLGFFGDSTYACNRLNLSVGPRVVLDGAPFSPLQITAGPAANDRIDIVHATDVASAAHVRLGAASTGTAVQLRSLLPVAVGQTVLLAPQAPSATVPCVVRSVTAVQAATATAPQQLGLAASGLHNQAAFSTPGASSDLDRIALLGTLRWVRYRREGARLLVELPLGVAGGPVVSEVLLRNVVALRAQYGVSTAAGNRSLQSWQDATGDFATVNATNIARVRALRVGVVTRSPQREKPDASGLCTATPTLPLLFGTQVQPDVPDWQCFRFRSAEVVVPLRNFAMGLTPTTATVTAPLP